MEVINLLRYQINWVGQTDLWPAKDENWAVVRHQLFLRYQKWSQALAFKFFTIYRVDTAESSDYLHYASIGLLESIDRFEPKYQVHFKSYAKKRIKGCILNNIVKFSEQSSSAIAKNNCTRERLESIKEPNNSNPNNALDSLINVVLELAVGFVLEEETQASHQFNIENVGYNSLEVMTIQTRILQNVDELPEQQKYVMLAHYIHFKSFTEIANELELSLGRVSQIHKNSLKTLRHRLSW
jgi:RNA polymerase sigma factor for flagellar operon FliA